MQIVFFSLTGQTRFFIQKLKLEKEPIEITADYPDIEMSEPFILLAPTYAEHIGNRTISQDILDPIFEFMETNNNSTLCSGLIGSGDKNFGDLFAFTAKELSKKYNIPIVHMYEKNGTIDDVDYVKSLIK